MVILKIRDEFNSIQKLFNVLDVQFFDIRLVDFNNVHEKPTKVRFAIMLAKLIFIAVLYGINVNDMKIRTLIGSSLVSAIQFFFQMFCFFLLVACIMKPYMATRKVKEIYLNIIEILNLLDSCFSINFNFISYRKRFFARFIIVTFTFSSFYLLTDDIMKTLQFYLIFTLYPTFINLFFMIYYVFFVDMLNQMVNLVIEAVKKLRNESNGDQSFEQKIYKLNICRRIFNKIIDCGLILNECFSLVILFELIFLTIMMTVTGYKLLVSNIDKKELKDFYGEKS